jgi:hypothetical protein
MKQAEKIIDRIKKLTAKANSAYELGNVEEATAFTNKVNELLTEYQIDMSKIVDAPVQDVNGYRETELGLNHRWKTSLLNILCKHNYCEAIFHTRPKQTQVTIIGKSDNVEVVKFLYGVLVPQFERMSAAAWKTYLADIRLQLLNRGYAKDHKLYKNPWTLSNISNSFQYKNSFYRGANSGINKRLTEQKAAANQQYGESLTSLIVVNDAAIKEYIKTNMGKIGSMKGTSSKLNGDAYKKGVEAGQNATIARGVSFGERLATRMIA